ncbi:hypothetical protein HDU97_009126 [Phlyctochytrium planicorne]|nr:hypothetical protein HDU97_009126 [Phlyctochytrium planicorne]
MDPSMLAVVPKDRLELMLRVLQESRLLVEAEAKKNEEIRKAREIELAINSIQKQMGVDSDAPPAAPKFAKGPHKQVMMANALPTPSKPTVTSNAFFAPEISNELIFSGDMMIHGAPVQTQSLADRFYRFERLLTPQPSPAPAPAPAPHTSLLSHPPPHPATSSASFKPEPTFTDFSTSQPTENFTALLTEDEDWLKDLLVNISSNHSEGDQPPNISLAAAAAVAASSFELRYAEPNPSNSGSSSTSPSPSPMLPIDSNSNLMDEDRVLSPVSVRKANESVMGPDGKVDADDDLPPLNLSKTAVRRRCRCRDCAKGLSILILHGDFESLSDPYSIEVTCVPCYGKASSSDVEIVPEDVRARGRKRRVNVFGRDRPARCEACGQGIGFGGVRRLPKDTGSDSTMSRERVEWEEPRFGVETVCDSCVKQFDFCTQCGGGGCFRTGKWRPRQLFKANRKTCMLSHTRVGDLDNYHAVSYRCPWERLPEFTDLTKTPSKFDPQPIVERNDPIIAAFLRGGTDVASPITGSMLLRQAADHVAELHSHAYHTFFAIPAVMRVVEFLGSWELLNARCNKIQEELDMLILGGHNPIPPNRQLSGEVRRFAAVAHVVKAGKPAVKRKDVDNGVGNIAPTIFAVGLTTAQWMVAERHVLLALGVVLGTGSLDKPGSMTHTLHASMMRRILNDVKTEGLPVPLHVWTLYRRKLSGVSAGNEPELVRAGFKPIDEYCTAWGYSRTELENSLESFIFDNNFVHFNYTIFIARWDDLAWTWGNRDL